MIPLQSQVLPLVSKHNEWKSAAGGPPHELTLELTAVQIDVLVGKALKNVSPKANSVVDLKVPVEPVVVNENFVRATCPEGSRKSYTSDRASQGKRSKEKQDEGIINHEATESFERCMGISLLLIGLLMVTFSVLGF